MNREMSGAPELVHIVFGMDPPVHAGMNVSRMVAHGPGKVVRCQNLLPNQKKSGVPNKDNIVYGMGHPAPVGMSV